MSNIKKLMMSAAGGGGLDVDEVFSTYLYYGNNSTNRTITNGIDLAGAGGLTWIKNRDTNGFIHELFDTERGATYGLQSQAADSEFQNTATLKSFNSDGFTLGNNNQVNSGSRQYTSWTFRKAPKFFDVVTYTGTGSPTTISHNLGSEPGMIMVKRRSGSEAGGIAGWWVCYHKGLSTPESGAVFLNSTDARNTAGVWNNTAPTSTEFTVNNNYVNYEGDTYVAYLFADNDGDGEFGPDGDQDIIKCGSFTGAGYAATDEFNVDLGFEPQWILVKRWDNSGGGGWFLVDNMRGWRPETSSNFQYLQAQTVEAEQQSGFVGIRSDGFRVRAGLNRKYIYMTIRRGPLAPPESATDVFEPVAWTGNNSSSGSLYQRGSNPIDMALINFRTLGASKYITTRLLGENNTLQTAHDGAETQQALVNLDTMTGLYVDNPATWNSSGLTYISHQWKRAPGYFDVVPYTGEGGVTSTNLKKHNLTVPPEMIWVKNRTSGDKWIVWHKGMGASESYTNKLYMHLNETNARASSNYWSYNGNPQMDEQYFSVGSTYRDVNEPGQKYVAYLFATVPGISKVGFYTGNGSSQTIDCGFTSGARFVLTKRSNSTGYWNVFDTARGIVSGNDPRMEIGSNFTPEDTGHDYVDPANSGFTVNYIASDLDDSNINGAQYIFYAVA